MYFVEKSNVLIKQRIVENLVVKWSSLPKSGSIIYSILLIWTKYNMEDQFTQH